jgi:hypothetical protein
MRAKALLILLPLLILPVLLAQPTQAQADYTTDYELNTYTETKIIVSYDFTDQVAGNATSAGKSKWEQQINPMSSTFITDESDRYTWNLIISYTNPVTQLVTVTIFSGNEAVDIVSFTATTERLVLNFQITVTEQPEYPTAEELADKAIEVLDNRMAEYTAEMREMNGLSRQHDMVQWIVVGVAFCASLIVVLKYKAHKEET